MLPWHSSLFQAGYFFKTSDVTEALQIEYKLAFVKKKKKKNLHSQGKSPFVKVSPTLQRRMTK